MHHNLWIVNVVSGVQRWKKLKNDHTLLFVQHKCPQNNIDNIPENKPQIPSPKLIYLASIINIYQKKIITTII